MATIDCNVIHVIYHRAGQMSEFLTGRDLSDRIRLILGGEHPRSAVAFIGQGAEKDLKLDTKIICNLSMGGTNPRVIKDLMNLGFDIRQSDRLHSKVYVSSRGAVVCSANLSINGLGIEGQEHDGWIEAGIFSESSEEINGWLEAIPSRVINQLDIDLAQKKWDRRLHIRVSSLANIDLATAKQFSLYWWADADPSTYTIYHEKIAARVGGDYSYELAEEKNFYVSNTEPDNEIEGKYFLIYKLSGSGKGGGGKASALNWVFAEQKILDGAEDGGETYPLWIDAFPPRPAPVELTTKDKIIMLKTLNQEKYEILRQYEWRPWFTSVRKAKMAEFWMESKHAAMGVNK